MTNDIIELNSLATGPTSIILVGVHGNERCGVEALEKLLPTLRISRGRVLIGYGNPRAIEQDARFTEMNLNRAFKEANLFSEAEKETYEYQRAQFLKPYLDQADALLDIHASFSKKSKRFIICENDAKKIAKYLPCDLVASGFDKLEPGGTDGYMYNRGKIGICVECGCLSDTASTEVAEKAILAFLITRGHIDGQLNASQQSNINFDYLYFTKTNNFKLAKEFDDFEELSSGQLIGLDGLEEIRAPKSGVIIFARDRNLIGDEAFLFGEYIKNPGL